MKNLLMHKSLLNCGLWATPEQNLKDGRPVGLGMQSAEKGTQETKTNFDYFSVLLTVDSIICLLRFKVNKSWKYFLRFPLISDSGMKSIKQMTLIFFFLETCLAPELHHGNYSTNTENIQSEGQSTIRVCLWVPHSFWEEDRGGRVSPVRMGLTPQCTSRFPLWRRHSEKSLPEMDASC